MTSGRGGHVPAPPRRWLSAVSVVLALLVAGAWATASAPGSSPDDDFHLASIWCAWGQEASGCTVLSAPESPEYLTVSVPDLFIQSSSCSAFKPQVSAGCAWLLPDGSVRADPPDEYPLRANNGGYPGGYYALMRLFVTDSAATSIVLIRVASALISLALLAAAGLLITRADRWRLWHSWLVVSVPLGVFVFASTNPSGVAIAGAAAILPLSIAAVSAPSPARRWLASGVAALAAVLAVTARSDAVFFCGIALASGLAVAAWRREGWLRSAVPALPVALVLAVAFLVPDAGDLAVGSRPDVERQAPTLANLLNSLSFYIGDFATRLGWLDVPLPTLAWGSMALALGALLAMGVGGLGLRRALASSVLLVAAVAIPLLMLERTGYRVGEWVQARYVMPVVFLLVALLSLHGLDGGRVPNRRQLVWVAALASAAHTISLHAVMRRYITGNDVAAWDLNTGMEWWWDVPVDPMAIWWIGSLAFAALAVLVSIRAGGAGAGRRMTPEPEPTTPLESLIDAPA